jgi:hypothetical protein
VDDVVVIVCFVDGEVNHEAVGGGGVPGKVIRQTGFDA